VAKSLTVVYRIRIYWTYVYWIDVYTGDVRRKCSSVIWFHRPIRTHQRGLQMFFAVSRVGRAFEVGNRPALEEPHATRPNVD